MTAYRRTRVVGCVLSLAAISFVACGGERPVAAPDRETLHQGAVTRSTLAEVSEAARGYGRTHLGHYLELNARTLRAEGLEVPDRVSLEIESRHTTFCIRATNEALPSIHPWAIGTVTSRDRRPSTSDRCRT